MTGGPLTARCLRHLSGVDTGDLIDSVLASGHLVAAYGERFLTRPAFLEADQLRALESDLSALSALLAAVPGRLFGGDLRAACRAAGMTPYQADAVVRTADDAPAPLCRADLYQEDDGFRLLEFNIVSALGGLEIAALNRVLLRHPALARFADEAGLRFTDPLARLAQMIKADCENRDAGPIPVVAITDTPANFAPFGERFRFMADTWSGMGLEGMACPLDQFEERSGRLFAAGRPVDVVFRYFLMEDLLDPDSQRLIEPVLRAAEDGRVCLLSRMDSELYGSKGMLALLSDEANRSAFAAQEAALIGRLVPWTRTLRPGPSTADGAEVDLLDFARAKQDELVLKPVLMHGGIGVVPGWAVSREEWRESLLTCAGGPYVLQRRVRPVAEDFPVAGRPGELERLALNWGVFLVGGEYAGTLLRGAADPDVGVLSRATGARTGCCFHELE